MRALLVHVLGRTTAQLCVVLRGAGGMRFPHPKRLIVICLPPFTPLTARRSPATLQLILTALSSWRRCLGTPPTSGWV